MMVPAQGQELAPAQPEAGVTPAAQPAAGAPEPAQVQELAPAAGAPEPAQVQELAQVPALELVQAPAAGPAARTPAPCIKW